jgi:hypothetical protein
MPAPTTIAGILDIDDADSVLVNEVGQETVFQAINEYSARLNESLNRITGLFVETTTTKHQWTYRLPGNRELQTQGGMARAAEQKFKAEYMVALPIFQFGDALGGSFVEMAYTSIADVDRQVVEIGNAARRTLRKEILKALFNNTAYNYDDIVNGTLSIKTLANQDGTYYPPLPGADDLAEAQHYGEAGYAVSGISDSNDPIKWHADKLVARYPDEVDGLVFISTDMVAKVSGLALFEEVNDPRIVPGGLSDRLVGIPDGVPGKVIGRMHGVWVVKWADLPATYSLSLAPSYEKPLQKRIDPPSTGLPSDLRLIKQSDLFPLEKSEWMWRFGMGVVNRLNGFILEVANGGTYSVPASLAR